MSPPGGSPASPARTSEPERGEPTRVRGQEVDEPPGVDRDQPGLAGASAVGAPSANGREELQQHVVVGPVAFVLAAVVVGAQPAAVGQPQVRPVGPRRSRLPAAFGSRRDEPLKERGLAVARVAGDDDQAVAAVEHIRDQVLVQRRRDVGAVRVRRPGCPRC